MKRFVQQLKKVFVANALRITGIEIKAEYITTYPSPQNSLDIFKGEWISKLPSGFENLTAGDAGLFDDGRIAWLGERLNNIETMRVFECGPLEGGHTYSLEKLGVASIVAVEASTHSFLRCLLLKELIGTRRSRFLLGDFVKYLQNAQQTSERFDLVLACGVLYHLTNPVEAIAVMSKVTDQVYIWTQYYDEAKINASTTLKLRHRFKPSVPAEYDGFKHTHHPQVYQTRLGNAGFIGGLEPHSNWISREDLIGALNFFGFDDIEIHFDHPDEKSGPSISLLAKRTRS